MKYALIGIFLLMVTSCSKKEVKLPQIHTKTVTEVFNNSQIWIFYEVKGQDTLAVLNRNNSISTTNWLFNIDRRLQLKHLYYPFNEALVKRHKKSMHHVEGMRNYFSFVDTLDKKVKFLPFNIKETQYKNPLLNDTVVSQTVFYTHHFKYKSKTYNYSSLDSILKTLSNKNTFYYQNKLSYGTYLEIKSKIYTLSAIDTLQPITDYYFK